MLKLAHVVIVSPGRAGLYETTRELVKELRNLGIESRMYDPSKRELHPGGEHDRGAPFCDLDWAKDADLLVSHSGLGVDLEKTTIPVLQCLHGRPEESLLLEFKGELPVYSYQYAKNKDPRFKAAVTFWPQNKEYHEVMWPDTSVHVVTAPVDLKAWTPEGPADYDFNGKGSSPNVVCADSWRNDKNLFGVINAFSVFTKTYPTAKLHIYGAPKDARPYLMQAPWCASKGGQPLLH